MEYRWGDKVPVISRFYGVVIIMYFKDHNPPHLHAKYAGFEALMTFDGALLEGELPNRAINLVRDWIHCHRRELIDNWERARSGVALEYIAPLE